MVLVSWKQHCNWQNKQKPTEATKIVVLSSYTNTHTPFGRCYLYRLWKHCVKIECGKRISNWNTVPRRQVECKRTEQHINQIKIKTRNCLKMDKCRCRMHFKHMWLDRACIEFGSSEREKERERKRNKKRIRKLAPARVLNKRERGLGAGLMKGHLRSERYKLNFPMLRNFCKFS